MLEKLLKNKAVKNAFLSQFKDIVDRENLKAIVINISDKGEFEPVLYTEEIQVLKKDEYNKLINSLKSQL